jgi:hypothetical protein
MELKTPTAVIIMAMEEEANVLPDVDHLDVEVTMVTMGIVKKTAKKGCGRMLPAKVSMVPPIGQNRKHHQLEKMKNMEPKDQLVKCTLANLQQCFQVFNEGRSYFTEIHPKNIFFNDYDLVFCASTEI